MARRFPPAPSAAMRRAALAALALALLAWCASCARQPTVGQLAIKWGTESEEECYGFNIYRAPSVGGPFEKINGSIIPGSGTTHVPRRYERIDRPLPMHTTFYYYIEQVDYDGSVKKITPTVPATVKTPIAPDE